MRYIDSGSRNPTEALGAWLEKNVLHDHGLQQLRWQSGFFSADALGYFAAPMSRLRTFDGVLHVLIGSNDSKTSVADAKALLAAAGAARKNQRLGIVNFANAYFHPKTIHIVRKDKSRAAYVGSANLTGPGLTGMHVEAGLLLDTDEGDDPSVLDRIAHATDQWFAASLKGLNVVATAADIDHLAEIGVLSVAPIPSPSSSPSKAGASTAPFLKPLVQIPKLPPTLPTSAKPMPAVASTPKKLLPADAVWSKKLSPSDAQQKSTGNQRGSITLVKAGYPIDANTYFRDDFFGGAIWTHDLTSTGKKVENATIDFHVDFMGGNVGTLQMPVSYAPNRESAQANYTTLLHIGPLASYFQKYNLSGAWLVLRRIAGAFYLSIQASAP